MGSTPYNLKGMSVTKHLMGPTDFQSVGKITDILQNIC